MLARTERKAQLREALGVVSRVGLVADRGLWSVVAATRLLLDLLSGKASRRASDAAANARLSNSAKMFSGSSPSSLFTISRSSDQCIGGTS